MDRMFDNVMGWFRALEDRMTLKSDYTEELEELGQIESDLSVLRYMGTPVWKITDARQEIKRVREWIYEEIAAKKNLA